MKETTKENKTTAIIAGLKKEYNARAVERKDFPLKDLFMTSNPKCKKYQQEDGSVLLEITGFASKFIPKYANETNMGFHTLIYLSDGLKTGSFSGALYNLARFFYDLAKLPQGEFSRVNFDKGNFIKMRITKIDLPDAKTTYNFEIIDGELTGYEKLGDGAAMFLLPETVTTAE